MTSTATPIIYRANDAAERFLARIMRKPRPRPALERMNEEAFDYYNMLTGRPDVPERIESKFLEVPAGEEEMVAELGAQLVEGVWTAPEGKDLTLFEPWWPKVPEDLLDKNPQNLTTKDGDPLEAYLRPSDTQRGDDSTATPLVYGMLVLISALSYFLSSIHPLLGLVSLLTAAPFLVALSQGEGIMDAIRSGFMLLLFPFVFASAASAGSPLLSRLSFFNSAWTALKESVKSGNIDSLLMVAMQLAAAVFALWTVFIVLMVLLAIWSAIDTKKKQSTIGASAEGFKGFWVRFKSNAKWAAATTLLLGVSITLLPAPMLPFFGFLMASLYPLIHTEANYMNRTKELEALGINFRLARMGTLTDVHVKPKLEQAISAMKDKTPKFVIATATGWLAKKKHPNAPDAGMDMVLSALDTHSHLIVYGATGAGKTTNAMRPIAKQWIQSGAGGFLCLCGKGSLPGEISSLIELMIRPGVDYAPLQGLDAQGVAIALNSIQVDSKNNDGSIWDGGAKDFIDHLTVLHQALRDHERSTMKFASQMVREKEEVADYWVLETVKLTKQGLDAAHAQEQLSIAREQIEAWRQKQEQYVQRQWLWNIDTLVRLRNMVNAVVMRSGVMGPGKELMEALNELGYMADPVRRQRRPQTIHPEIGQGSLLDGTLEYFAKTWPQTDEKQRSSFLINVDARLLPLTRGRFLVGKTGIHWKMLEEGEDVGACLYGKSVGVDLPATLHGRAGLAITTLVKQRVYDGGSLRATRKEADWMAEGQTPLMIMLDEAHLLIGDPEANLATIARSLRLSFVVATQNYENLIARFGGDANAADQFDSAFQSFICMETSPRTYQRIRERLGLADLISFKQEAIGIDYMGALTNFALSPLNDPAHPNRAGMERLLKLGFGNPVVRIPAMQNRSTFGWGRAATMQLDENSMLEEMIVPIGGHRETRDVFEEQEYQALLTRGQAIVFLKRAGYRRVDLARLNPVFADELRADLPDIHSFVSEEVPA